MNITRSSFSGIIFISFFLTLQILTAQIPDSAKVSLEGIFKEGKYHVERPKPISWINGGESYVTIENNSKGGNQLINHSVKNNEKDVFLSAERLTPPGAITPLRVEDFSLSPDGSKVLIFTNSKRVWRSNTRGDFWVYDFDINKLSQLGKSFDPSTLMFAKFSNDEKTVAYVQDFNLYSENYETGEIKKLTDDGDGDIINGTFDWVYEEEFGDRDGFTWSPGASKIAFWQLDASEIGTFYMINNTDSIYSKPIPIQYPKAGSNPSSAKIGIVDTQTQKIKWLPIPGDPVQHYLPSIQWVGPDLLLVQQLNREQNELNIYTYNASTDNLKKIYTQTEDTWVDIQYPDISSTLWGENELMLADNKSAFLRMTENDGWRHIYKINISNGEKQLLTPGNYDVASIYGINKKDVYFSASPENATQRYLYSISLNGKGDLKRITPSKFEGINTYNISPNTKYAIHDFTNVQTPMISSVVKLPDHERLSVLIDNKELKKELGSVAIPEVEFKSVPISDSLLTDARIIKPVNFDKAKKYPVLFHVYGEPAGTVANDSWIGMYNIFLAQQGFVIIDMDNRGTPSLKGSEWRKSIYTKVGVLNSEDQAAAAENLLEDLSYLDPERVNVWGWSGGGSMTLNLMFRYPEIYKTGVAVAAVANQRFYDNIYQERYMGLPQKNSEAYRKGSPVTYAKNLEGDLLLIHGTGDDNVHFQNAEFLINELIRQNKQFQLMIYPNRTHGIYEGKNTRIHLYTLITQFLQSKNNLD